MFKKDRMKGLDIAQSFFFEWGLPFLEMTFPELSMRIAAGRLEGSDVLGADDEISRDHNWGPQFVLFLSEKDYAEFGAQLSVEANSAAPAEWHGHRVAGAGDKSVLVESIPQWFDRRLHITRPPKTRQDWMALLEFESSLYFLRHGTVWLDRSGELSAWRKSLHHWPEYALTKRLTDECFRAWHHGEYNFVQRMAKRRDPLSITICLGEFVTGIMRAVFLLQNDFTPYWKWLPFEFRKLPEAQVYTSLLEELVALSDDVNNQVRLVRELCRMLHEYLVSSGHTTGRGGNPYLLPLLNDFNELQNKLK